jgi:hypothetical protein
MIAARMHNISHITPLSLFALPDTTCPSISPAIHRMLMVNLGIGRGQDLSTHRTLAVKRSQSPHDEIQPPGTMIPNQASIRQPALIE